jgi:hypothetical protein
MTVTPSCPGDARWLTRPFETQLNSHPTVSNVRLEALSLDPRLDDEAQ